MLWTKSYLLLLLCLWQRCQVLSSESLYIVHSCISKPRHQSSDFMCLWLSPPLTKMQHILHVCIYSVVDNVTFSRIGADQATWMGVYSQWLAVDSTWGESDVYDCLVIVTEMWYCAFVSDSYNHIIMWSGIGMLFTKWLIDWVKVQRRTVP